MVTTAGRAFAIVSALPLVARGLCTVEELASGSSLKGARFIFFHFFISIYLCRVKYAAIEADLYTALPKQN